MDLKGSIRTFVRITSGAVHETTIFRNMPLEPSAIYVMDKVCVLVAIIKKELKLEHSLHEILQILSILLFEKTSLKQVLTGNYYFFLKNK